MDQWQCHLLDCFGNSTVRDITVPLGLLAYFTVSDPEGYSGLVSSTTYRHPNSPRQLSMLSNQNTNPDQRQLRRQHQQHRRQHSIPTSTDTANVPILTANPIQRSTTHRRGQSLEHRVNTRSSRRQPQIDQKTVSTIIEGYEQQHQHVLREAQQQRLARPGQQRQSLRNQDNQTDSHSRRLSIQECKGPPCNNEYARLVTQHRDDATIRPSRISGNRSEGQSPNSDIFSVFNACIPAGSPPGDGLVFDENGGVLNSRTHVSHSTGLNGARLLGPEQIIGVERQPMRAPMMSSQPRPHTPPNHSNQSFFPITPAATPHDRIAMHQPRQRISVDLSNFMGDETIKPSRIPKEMCKDLFPSADQLGSDQVFPSPPQSTAKLEAPAFDSAPVQGQGLMDMSSMTLDFSGSEGGYDSSYYSPLSSALSPSMGSFQSSPEMAHMDPFGPSLVNNVGATDVMMDYTKTSEMDRSFTADSYPMTRQSTSEGAPSVDATVEDTGITVEDIAIYIDGPDQEGKWVCMFPECDKRFGRKENIKSHVQTHLGDRQFRCNHCKKCFVRQHDLKRHAKIHSGLKPYPCKCGHSFARHDALTRHRQRGMCVGAFENVRRKIVKRGRPRKHRPDDEERSSKSAKTRTKVQEKEYASSVSGTSQSSFAASPGHTLDSFSSREASPYDHESPISSAQHIPSMPGTPFQFTPPASPQVGMDRFVFPQQVEQLREVPFPSTQEETEIAHSQLQSLASRPISQYDTPPDLDLSSSSPAPSRFFDLEAASVPELSMEGVEETLFDYSTSMNLDFQGGLNMGIMKFDSLDMESDLSSLERDPSLLFTKFEGDPWAASTLLQDNIGTDDVFFGSP
ncbi:MAG: hypothetical protein M1814_002564 [Vezdaea aestivalis]|nr:MAG: hypothetical protein M1814_002564 [Vezdaea aestivalis]